MDASTNSDVSLFFFFFLVKGPATDAIDGRLIEQPYEEVDEVFSVFSILMDHRWNEIDRGKPKYLEKNLFQCHFVHHKFHMDPPGIESGRPR
jgi:hypothetical protein